MKTYYWEVKTDTGICWLKTDLQHLSPDKVFLSLRLDNVIDEMEEIEHIKQVKEETIGAFNLRAFTYSYNEKAIDELDPTPWCHVCHARRRNECDCGKRAENE